MRPTNTTDRLASHPPWSSDHAVNTAVAAAAGRSAHKMPTWPKVQNAASATTTAAAVVVALAAFCTFGHVGILWALLPAAAATAVLTAWSLDHGGWLARRSVVFVGRISYGLYLWHYPVAHVVRHHLSVPGLPITVAISVVLAVMSWCSSNSRSCAAQRVQMGRARTKLRTRSPLRHLSVKSSRPYREPRASDLVEREFLEPVADRFQTDVYGSGDLSDVDMRSAVGPMGDT